jgi:hypothetical protein
MFAEVGAPFPTTLCMVDCPAALLLTLMTMNAPLASLSGEAVV